MTAPSTWALLCTALIVALCGLSEADPPLPGGQAFPATRPGLGDGERSAPGMVRLNLPESVEVRFLAEYVSDRLGINIIYDEQVGSKRVTLKSPVEVPRQSLLGLLESVLKMKGLVLTDADQPGWKRIAPVADLRTVTRDIREQTATAPAEGANDAVTQVVRLQHVAPQGVETLLKPFLTQPGANTVIVPDQPLLIVTDYASNLPRLLRLIELADRAGPPVKMEFLTLAHGDAAAAAQEVSNILRERNKALTEARQTPAAAPTLLPLERTNQIVLIGTGEQVAEAIELVRGLDQPIEVQTVVYQFQAASPARVERIARELVDPRIIQRRYRSSVDEPGGLLIVTAPAAVHERIAALKAALDVPNPPQRSPIRFYKLMNASAAEVMATIQSLQRGQGGLAGIEVSGERAGEGKDGNTGEQATGTGHSASGIRENAAAPRPADGLVRNPESGIRSALDGIPSPGTGVGGTSQEKQGDNARTVAESPRVATRGLLGVQTPDAVVTADVNTNTIIVVAPPAVQRIYQELIETLDKRRPQVLVEAILVTLDTSGGFSLGVEVLRKGASGDDEHLVFSSFGLSAVDPIAGSLALRPGVGFNGALISPDTVDVVVKALASSGRAKVVAAPKVLVNDNATGTLSSVAEAPFTSVNASDTVATTSFAGYASAGTTVTVSPRISEGDHLRMAFSVTLNSFTGEGSAGIPPPRQTNTISSEVTVPDGYAVIVGGLNRQDLSQTVSRVPWLGEWPVLEYLFGNRSDNDSRSTLFVFLRPVILRDDDFADLKYLSEKDLERAELPGHLPASSAMTMD